MSSAVWMLLERRNGPRRLRDSDDDDEDDDDYDDDSLSVCLCLCVCVNKPKRGSGDVLLCVPHGDTVV